MANRKANKIKTPISDRLRTLSRLFLFSEENFIEDELVKIAKVLKYKQDHENLTNPIGFLKNNNTKTVLEKVQELLKYNINSRNQKNNAIRANVAHTALKESEYDIYVPPISLA
ncbi:hypothetical protein [Candidatus Syntrophocurvum alkaliphilum]|uniref:hypothetical protein n=1 Tax=Candidatus Syntrophocurvum alkaliphilum TaxID=2293317 RepID=UPI0012E1717F|nr:hypothetical protein [Candidatus Syntrophocurvum alkaliphilum]